MDVRPYGFVLVDCAWAFDVVWVDYAWVVDVVGGGLRVNGYFVCVGLCGKI